MVFALIAYLSVYPSMADIQSGGTKYMLCIQDIRHNLEMGYWTNSPNADNPDLCNSSYCPRRKWSECHNL